jgi:hypothetical protein
MVQLYYSTSSCSAASFISAYMAGLKDVSCHQVDVPTHRVKDDGSDFYQINPKCVRQTWRRAGTRAAASRAPQHLADKEQDWPLDSLRHPRPHPPIPTRGNVPCLRLDDGTVLNENASVLSKLAEMVRVMPRVECPPGLPPQ